MISRIGATTSRSCCPRTCRSNDANCSGSTAPRSSSPGGEGSTTGAPGAKPCRGASGLGVPVPVRQRGQPPGALPDDRPRIWSTSRHHTLRRRTRHLGNTARLRHGFLKEQNPDVQVFAVEPPSGELVEGLRSLDDGYIPPVFDKWGGYDLLDGKSIVRPASRSSTPAAWPRSGSSPASPRGPLWPGRSRSPRGSSPVSSSSSSATTAGSTCRPGRGPGPRQGRRQRRGHLLRSLGAVDPDRDVRAPVPWSPCVTVPSACSTRASAASPSTGPSSTCCRPGPRLPGRHRSLPYGPVPRRGRPVRPPDRP